MGQVKRIKEQGKALSSPALNKMVEEPQEKKGKHHRVIERLRDRFKPVP